MIEHTGTTTTMHASPSGVVQVRSSPTTPNSMSIPTTNSSRTAAGTFPIAQPQLLDDAYAISCDAGGGSGDARAGVERDASPRVSLLAGDR